MPRCARFLRLRSFRYGFTLPRRAAGVIAADRALLGLSALPIALTGLVYVFVVRRLTGWLRSALLGAFLARGWDPEGWPLAVVGLFADGMLLVVGALAFAFTAAVFASPLNDLLAARAERYCDPPLPPPLPATRGRVVELALADLTKNALTAAAGLAALTLWWVPVVNLLCLGAAFVLVTFQYTSYAQTRRGIGLRAGVRFLVRHRWACAGLGVSVTLLFLLPLVGTLGLPLAVVSGTLLVGRAQPSDRHHALR